MASKNRTTLKGFFETGDTPSEAQYADLIDSKLNLSETSIQQVSSDIYSYKTINFIDMNSNGITYVDSNGGVRFGLQFSRAQNLVSLSNRASNGFVQIRANGSSAGSGGEVTSSIFTSYSNEFLMPVTASKAMVVNSNLTVAQEIIGLNGISGISTTVAQPNITSVGVLTSLTVSGNISASNTSTASFGSAILSNLPTTTPTTIGSLWLSGSNAEGTSKHLMVFTG